MKRFQRLLAVAILLSICLLKTYAHTKKDSGEDIFPFQKAGEVRVKLIPFKPGLNAIRNPYFGIGGLYDNFRIPKTNLLYPKLKIFSDIRNGAPRLSTLSVNDSTYKNIIDNFDCIRLSLFTSSGTILIGEEFEITIKAEYILGLEIYQVALEGCNDFTLKMVFPEGFVQTGGEYYDFMGLKLDASNRLKEIKIKGKFISESQNTCFQVMKGPKFINQQSLFIRKDTACVSYLTDIVNIKNTKQNPETQSQTIIGKNNNTLERSVTDIPIITASKENLCQGTALTLFMLGCSGTVKWDVVDNGTAKTITGTSATFIPTVPSIDSSATYPITYIGKCYKTDGQAFTSATSPQIIITVNHQPLIIKRNTYSSNGSSTRLTSIVLEAKGCEAGSIIWSNGITGESSINVTYSSGTYTARCSKNNCLSLPSNKIVLNSASARVADYINYLDYCAVNRAAGFDFTWAGVSLRSSQGSYYIVPTNVAITQMTGPFNPNCTIGSPCSIPGSNTNGTTFKGTFLGEAEVLFRSIRVRFDFSDIYESDDYVFNLNIKPTVSLTHDASTLCPGTRITLTALPTNPSTPGYIYTFTGPVDSHLAANGNQATADDVYDHMFSVVVSTTFSSSCTNSSQTYVTGFKHKPIAAISGSGVGCSGQTITLTATSPPNGQTYSYNWSTGATTQSISVTNSGNYSVTITANGCSHSNTRYIQFNSAPTPTISGNANICPGTSNTLTANGCNGGVLIWSNGSNGSTINVSPSSQTTYTVTCFANDCSSTSAPFTINMLSVPNITTTSTSGCGYADLTASASNIVAYQWSGPNSFTSSNQNPRVYTDGTYTVTATNNVGCVASKSQGSTMFVVPTVTLGSTANCGNATLTANASITSGTTYSWNGGGFVTNNSITVYSGGNYNVIAKTSNGCLSNTANTTASIKTVPSVSLSTPDVFCKEGSLTSTGSGGSGFSYSLNGGAYQGSGYFPIYSTGNYTVTVKNSDNCTTSSAPKFITINPEPTVNISGGGNVCRTTTLVANASVPGGTTFTYSWNGGAESGNNAFSTSGSGNYSVTAKTAAGCTATESANVNVLNPGNPSITPGTTLNPCPNESVTLYATCQANQTPKWYNGANLISSLTSFTASYTQNTTLTVKCSENILPSCESSGTTIQINVKTVTPPTISPANMVAICDYGSMNFNLSSNTCDANSIQWYLGGNAIAGQTGTSLNTRTQPGIYEVRCNANSCPTSKSVELKKANPIDATFNTNSPVCETNTITLTANNTTNSNYQWSGPGGFTASGVSPNASRTNAIISHGGTYTVTASKTFGSDMANITCTATSTKSVEIRVKPIASVTSNKSTLCVYETLQLNSSVSNLATVGASSHANLTYSWAGSGTFSSTSAQNPTVTNLTSGSRTYTVTITAPNGCSTTATITVTVVPRPTVSATTPSPILCSGSTLQLNATPDATQGTASYSWAGPNGFSSTSQNPSIANASFTNAGIYTLTVTQQCTATATVKVTIPELYTFNLAYNTPLCEGANLIAGVPGGADGYSGNFAANMPSVGAPPAGVDPLQYKWTGPNSFERWQTNDARLTISAITPIQAGTYTLSVWNNIKTCKIGEKTVTITVKPLPTAIALCPDCEFTTNTSGSCLDAPNGKPKVGSTLQLKPSTITDNTVSWVGPNGFSSPSLNPPQTIAIPNIQLNNSGIYVMTATLNGCTKTSSVTVTVVPSCTLVISSATVTCSNLKGNISLQLCGKTPEKITLYRLERKDPVTGQYTIVVSDWTTNAGVLSNIDIDGEYKVRVLERIAIDSQSGTCEASPAFVVIQAKPKCNLLILSSKNGSNVESSEIIISSNGTVNPLTVAVNGANALSAACASTPIAYSWEGPNGFCSTVSSNQVRVPGDYKVTITYGTGTATATCVLTKTITMTERVIDVQPESVLVRCISGVSYASIFKASSVEWLQYSTDLVNWSDSYQVPLNSCRPNGLFKIFVRDKNNPNLIKIIAEVNKTDCSCGIASFYIVDPIIDCSGSSYSLSALSYNSSGTATTYYNNRLNVKREDGTWVSPTWVTVTNNSWYAFTGLTPGKYTIYARPVGNETCETTLTTEIREQSIVTPSVYSCGGVFNVEENFDNPITKAITYTSNNNWAGNALSFNGVNHKAVIAGSTSTTNFSDVSDKFTVEAWINPDQSRVIKLFTAAQLITGNHLGWDHQHYLGISTAASGKHGLGISVGVNGINVIEHNLSDSKLNVVISKNYPFGGWAHIALVVDNTSTQRYLLYINGELVASGSSFNSATQTRPMVELGNLYGHYKGLLDEFRVWKIARTETEIKNNMRSVITSLNANLVRNYHFDEASGKNLVDNSGIYNGTFSYSDCSFRVKSNNVLNPAEYTWTGPDILTTTNNTIKVKYNKTSVTYTIKYKKPDGTDCTDNITLPAPPVCSDLQIAVSPTGTILEYSGVSPILTASVSNPNELTNTSFSLGKSLPSDGWNLNNNVCVVGGDACDRFSNFTVEAWIKPTAGTSISVGSAGGGTYSGDNNQKYLFRHPWTNNQDNTAGAGISVGANGINILENGRDANGNGFYRLRLSYAFSAANLNKYNGWIHVAVVYQNNKPTLFINGASVGTASQIFSESIMAPQAVGDMNGWGFRGLVDEVRFWRSVRSDTEIFNNFSKTTGVAGYDGYWKFETSSGGVVPGENSLRGLNIGSTTIPSTTTTLTVSGLPNISWYKGNVKVGDGEQYIIPTDEVVAGDYLYRAVFVKKDNTVCETNKIITISPQPVCPVTPGCYRIVTRHTTPVRAWVPAQVENVFDGLKVMEKLGFDNQTFRIICLNGSTPEYKILSTINGKALDIRPVNQQQPEWKDNVAERNEQKFLLYPQGDGSIRISPKTNSGYALQTGWNENDQVWMENWGNGDNQKWTFESTTCPTFEDNCTATNEFTLENWDFTTTEINQGINAVNQFPRWNQTADEVLIRSTELSASMSAISGSAANNYAMRLTGYICPPETGQYEIFVRGDDGTEFWLSTDDTPANQIKIAFANEYSPTFWNFGEQKSKAIGLIKGKKYFFEAKMVQSYGGDNITVAWRKVGETTQPVPIPAQYLSPYERCGIKVTQSPQKDEYAIDDLITLTATKPTAETGTPSYKWEVMPPNTSDLYQSNAYVATITAASGSNVVVKPRTAADPVTYKVSKIGDGTCFKLVRLKIMSVKCDCKEDCENLQSTFPDLANALSRDRSFIAETTYMAEGQGSPATKVTYYDGLGRPVQVINVGSGSNKQDIAQAIEYDAYGREPLKYLAYPDSPLSNGGKFIDNLGDNGAPGSGKTSIWHGANNGSTLAYTQYEFEKSPLNRVVKTAAPGNDIGGSSVISIEYGLNTSADAIKKLSYDFGTKTITVGSYTENKLFKIKSTDEVGLITIEYKDLENRIVCKDIGGLKTYYCYDDLGLFRCVVQPEGVGRMGSSFTLFGTSAIHEVIFAYDYNDRGLMIKKKVPGAAAVDMSYYPNNMPKTLVSKINETTVTELLEYDGLDRIISKKINGTEVMHNYYDTDAGFTNKVASSNTHTFGKAFITNLKGLLVGTEERFFDANGIYGTKTLATTLYYDNMGRVIRTARKNHLNGVDYTDNDLDFTGRILQVKSETNNGQLKTVMLTKNTYDAGSRVKSICQKINEDNWQPVARYTYNKLGESIQATLGCKQQVVDYAYNIRGWLKNINNPTDLRNTLDASKKNEFDFFGMTLAYKTDGNIDKQTYNHAQRKGTLYTEPYDITSYVTSGTPFEYTYGYDTQKRILSGTLKKGTSQVFALQVPSTNGYDSNGNIKSLSRTILTNNTDDIVDNLTYNYSGTNPNQLSSITENSNSTNKSKYFKASASYTYYTDGSLKSDNGKNISLIKYDYNRLPGEVTVDGKTMKYLYTATGTKVQTDDGNGKVYDYIGGIVYTNNQIEFVSTAAGRWLPKEQLKAYKADKTEAGEAKFGRYEYQIKDHLGNLRIACRCLEKGEVDKASRTPNDTYAPVVVQEQQYDPWGLDIGQEVQPFTSPLTTKLPDRRTYNGKETFAQHGYFEYGARWYDPANGRWGVIDPLAGKMPSYSPYVYGNNNPLRFIDPNGMEATLTQDLIYSDGYSTQNYKNSTGSVGVSGNLISDNDPKYSAKSDSKGGTIITRTQGNSTLTLTGEDANLFKILSIEGGYNGTPESREGEYGMAIIMASILNRLEVGYKPYPNDEAARSIQDVVSQRKGKEYNAYIDKRYQDNDLFEGYLKIAQKLYKKDAVAFFDLVFGLTSGKINPYEVLSQHNFSNSHQILSYQHVRKPESQYGQYSVMLKYESSKTHLTGIESSTNYFSPDSFTKTPKFPLRCFVP